MSRRRKKKQQQETLSIIGKVLILCLVVIAGYFTYVNYGDKTLNEINNKTLKTEKKKEEKTEQEKNDKETEKKEEKTEQTTKNESSTNNDEGEKKYTYKNQEGEKVTIKADKSVEATGFAGASNHKFFLRDTTLYYKNISKDEEEVILAYNVEDLLLENKQVTAVLAKDGKIVTENNYITYKNK